MKSLSCGLSVFVPRNQGRITYLSGWNNIVSIIADLVGEGNAFLESKIAGDGKKSTTRGWCKALLY